MANALIIYDGPGPLPQSATFQAPEDGPAVFVLSGTAWTQKAPVLISVNLSIDGNPVAAMMCFANQNANHQALRTTIVSVPNLSYGQHTIELTIANPSTVTDQNDYFQVSLLY